MPVRSAAAAAVEKATFDRAQLMALTASLRNAAPLELPRLLRAFGKGGDEAEGLAMVGALRQSAARSSVRGDILRPVLAKYPERVRRKERLLTSLTVRMGSQLRMVDECPAGRARRVGAAFSQRQSGLLLPAMPSATVGVRMVPI